MPRDRFEGAVTTPAGPDVIEQPVPERPARPLLIEVASALLIIGGLVGVATGTSPFQPGVGPLPLVIMGLNLLTIVVGVRIHQGRGWALALNVTAIALFLELTALPSPIAGLFALFDALVLVALVRHRAWFEWRPPDASSPPREG